MDVAQGNKVKKVPGGAKKVRCLPEKKRSFSRKGMRKVTLWKIQVYIVLTAQVVQTQKVTLQSETELRECEILCPKKNLCFLNGCLQQLGWGGVGWGGVGWAGLGWGWGWGGVGWGGVRWGDKKEAISTFQDPSNESYSRPIGMKISLPKSDVKN